jgi:GT2 family glycosyltransferase
VLITTKSGKGKPSLTFNATTSVSTIANRYDLASPQEFIYGIKKTLENSGIDASGVGGNDKGFNTDWQDQVFQTAVSNSYNLGWGFSNSKSSLKLNGSYDNQEGIVKTQGLKRFTFGLKYSNQLTSKLKLDVTANQSMVKNSYAQVTNNAGYQGSLIGAMIAYNPTFPVYNADGTWFDTKDGNRNPVAILEGYNDNDTYNKLLANVSLSYKINDNLTYKAIFGMENGASERLTYTNGISLYECAGGCFQMYHRSVIEKIGMYDEFYKNSWEHLDMTYRATLSGFHTPYWLAADIINSHEFIEQIDYQIESTISSNKHNPFYYEGLYYWKFKFGSWVADIPDWINEKYHTDEIINMFYYRKYDELASLFFDYYKKNSCLYFNKDYKEGHVFDNVWGFVRDNKPTLYTQ